MNRNSRKKWTKSNNDVIISPNFSLHPLNSRSPSDGNDKDRDDGMTDIAFNLRSREKRIDLSSLSLHTKVPGMKEEDPVDGEAYRLSRKIHLKPVLVEEERMKEKKEQEKTLRMKRPKKQEKKERVAKKRIVVDVGEAKGAQMIAENPEEHKGIRIEEIYPAKRDVLNTNNATEPCEEVAADSAGDVVKIPFPETSLSSAGVQEKSHQVLPQDENLQVPLTVMSDEEKKEVIRAILLLRNEIRKTMYATLSQREAVSKSSSPAFGKRFRAMGEIIKFLATSTVIFLITLSAINFRAYYQIARYYLYPEERQAMEQDLLAVTNERPKVLASRPKLLPVAGIERHISEKLFPMNIQVIPIDNRIVIPKIGINAPIVNGIGIDSLLGEDWKQLEKDIQGGLQSGVVHYPGTAKPGQNGNFFLTGHSSYYAWDPGDYKEIFSLLGKLEVGDTYTVYYDQQKYSYEVTSKEIISPKDTDVLDQPADYEISTLMTCWPPGTAQKRMILTAKRI